MDLVINLNKPKNITSHEAVSKIKKIIKAKKAGHCGTLDPFATGILLVCTGKATRLTPYFSNLTKEYIAVMKLGETTDTQDLHGKVIEKTDGINVTEAEIKNVLKSFEGKILQKPPMFSALKHKGVPLYKFARKGIDIPRNEREVYIYKIDLLEINLPFVTFRVLCSKGTYIRTLCNDIGKRLGTGAYLSQLERIAIGPFRINDSVTLETMSSIPIPRTSEKCRGEPSENVRDVYTMNRALSWMPEIRVKELSVERVKNGNQVTIDDCLDFPSNLAAGDSIKIKSPDGEFLAIGSLFENHSYKIKMDIVFD
ncbi:MAG: tRNA pseudouridine(55) synthase TruB [Nitrospirae bacterium]|nr:tRNA pseudouridine(55) synthase TruB [Nitrospirota bacterium]